MQQHGRFEQQIEFAEADRRRFRVWQSPYAGEQMLNGDFRRGGMKNELVGIFNAEGNYISVLQDPAGGDTLAVYKNAELVAAILERPATALRY